MSNYSGRHFFSMLLLTQPLNDDDDDDDDDERFNNRYHLKDLFIQSNSNHGVAKMQLEMSTSQYYLLGIISLNK